MRKYITVRCTLKNWITTDVIQKNGFKTIPKAALINEFLSRYYETIFPEAVKEAEKEMIKDETC